ncbi:MAG: putative prokaryotic signal transducing protein [Chloroflexota bacterium]|jgi:hypothetical protein|nr:putative prokaryotic signal transducing protein [Chloroflexota bacterium]
MSDEWVRIKTVSAMEGEILKAALENADIPVALRGDIAGRLYGITASDLGDVAVLVPPDRAEEARELIDSSEPIDFPEGD